MADKYEFGFALISAGVGVLGAYLGTQSFRQQSQQLRIKELQEQKQAYADQRVREMEIARDIKHLDRRITELNNARLEQHQDNESRLDKLEKQIDSVQATIQQVLLLIKEKA